MRAATPRRILHVDMDAFYASIEQRDCAELRGKAVVVGGRSDRGVVAAASYEARRFGIHSAMPMRDARRRCADLVCVPVRMAHYREVSKRVFYVFREFTPLVEGLSLDEAFLDVSGSVALFGDAERIAREIKARIRAETSLTASVGVAENKLVAKIASDLDKPDGLVVVDAANLHAVLDPLPVRVMPGIGPEKARRLDAAGIRTLGELRRAPENLLYPMFGRYTRRIRERANGIDDRPVVSLRTAKSLSAEETFDKDLVDRAAMRRALLQLAERTAGRLRARQLWAGTVQLKIRRDDFSTFTRQRTLQPPTSATDVLYDAACELLEEWLAEYPGAPVRLLGVGGAHLAPAAQRDLFDAGTAAGGTPLDRTVDEIRERFGSLAVGRARALGPEERRPPTARPKR